MKSLNIEAECEFDIEGENVFSVERARRLEKFNLFGKNEYSERTIIGFYEKTNKQKMQHWYLDCSHVKHSDFVRRFREKLCLTHRVQ